MCIHLFIIITPSLNGVHAHNNIIINPRRACAGGLRYLSCVCVRVCVCAPAPTTLVSTLKMGYVGVYLRLFLLFYVWVFDKSFRSKVMARKSQYANEQLPLATGFSPFYRAYISRYLQAAH